jgi:hypothetical protein
VSRTTLLVLVALAVAGWQVHRQFDQSGDAVRKTAERAKPDEALERMFQRLDARMATNEDSQPAIETTPVALTDAKRRRIRLDGMRSYDWEHAIPPWHGARVWQEKR